MQPFVRCSDRDEVGDDRRAVELAVDHEHDQHGSGGDEEGSRGCCRFLSVGCPVDLGVGRALDGIQLGLRPVVELAACDGVGEFWVDWMPGAAHVEARDTGESCGCRIGADSSGDGGRVLGVGVRCAHAG